MNMRLQGEVGDVGCGPKAILGFRERNASETRVFLRKSKAYVVELEVWREN
jgi:hypothetical protein